MSKFRPLSDYQNPVSDGYKLLPFRFTQLDGREYVITNQAGELYVLDRASLESLVRHQLPLNGEIYNDLKSKHFLTDADSSVAVDLLSLKVRTKLQRLAESTGLHIFVISLRCEHSCPYCQVSRQSDDKLAFDMSVETAETALALVFRSPSRAIKIEFQGGEPLLNFPLLRHVVERAEAINKAEHRNLQFVIATNLAVINDEMLDFCRKHDIHISTSLDGPGDLHNSNRPRPGNDSYERAIRGISVSREALGRDRVSALMTTTKRSLGRSKEIIDEYVLQGFNGIFLRPMSPYGFASKTKSFKAYNADEWLEFYFEGLEYILELNRGGYSFTEFYAATILAKCLRHLSRGL